MSLVQLYSTVGKGYNEPAWFSSTVGKGYNEPGSALQWERAIMSLVQLYSGKGL